MARKSSGTIPPSVNLKDSIELARDIYERGGGSMTQDDVAALMKLSSKSSGFRLKLAALRGFGLIQTEGQSVRISQLGKAIIAPTSESEHQAAVLAAFNLVSVYTSLHQRYQGGFLPEDNFLVNTVVKELSSPSEYKEKWIRSFKDSGRAAGLLREENGKMRVLRAPSPIWGHMKEPMPEEQRQERNDDPPERKQDEKVVEHAGSFPVVLDETQRTVFIPLDFTREDLEYLKGVLDLYVKRREAKRV